ncbi:ubiquitin carboxyl-terminal hydrolase 31 isoform X3 [Drosophila miranda]|nr:ubiquitin carboxyl-terminal hydrolase 31 isoform X3 [Drosophila miranda]
MGLKNHGNTCFMNAVLQCLSHTDILAEYFVLDQYKADLKRRNKINSRKFGTKGELTEQLANVLKALWTCRNESDHSTGFKAVVDRYGTQFHSSTQHDAQEFLFWLLDKVHEDLNTASKRRYKSIKNSYGRSDEIIAAETLANHIRCNNSFVQAVFQAQFRSSLTCPRCKKQSNTFDPFHCISVQLPQLTQQTIFVTVVYMKQQPRQIKMGLRVPAGSPIVALREQLQTDTGIAGSRMVLVDLNAEGFTRVFYDTQPVETLSSIESIYCIEVPEAQAKIGATPKAAPSPSAPEAAEKIASAPAPAAAPQADLLLLVANVYRAKDGKDMTRLGAPFSMKAPRDCSYQNLQKRMLREMSPLLKPEVFSYITPLADMFRIRLQDPSADPDTYLEQVEHPLLTEMIDMALSVLASEAGPPHIKLLLEWNSPEDHFLARQQETDDEAVVEHESVARLSASKAKDTAALTLEQCLEHYTKAETLSAEDAWRCPHCQQYLPVVKTLGLWSLPDILVVHFKRFRQHQSKGPQAAKLTTMVKFPLTAFDMSPHLAKGVHGSATISSLGILDGGGRGSTLWKRARSGDSRSSTLNSRCDLKDTRYDLYAVCYHQGDTLETGHYTAACKNPYDRQWYKFDDQRVSKVPEDDIEQDIINNEAYMLFYQRRSVDAAECSGSSSNSGDHWVSRIAPASVSATSSSADSTSGKENDGAIKAEAGSSEVAESGPAAENAQSKPVNIPLVNEEVAPETTEAVAQEEPKVAANELPALPLNIEELDFADADADVSLSEDAKNEGIEAPAEQSQTTAAAPKAAATIEEVTHIFAMDEEQKEEPVEVTKVISRSEILPESLPTAEVVRTNGHVSPSSSSASSESSLSSRSSPRSLTTSVAAASTLQNKLNGHMNTACSSIFNGNGNGNANANATHPQLSSSLQLTRQVLSNHNWHGSRSSVSAVENATHHQQKQQAAAAASLSLRHSFSTSSNYKLRECTETLSSLLRNSTNTCSKDTLMFIDQQSHHHTAGLIEDDDDSYMGRSLWISPVTPHKLITVSPKN